MDRYEMAHRWCNCNFGKNGGYNNSGAHVSCDENVFYSYSTVYAMWLDKTPGKKLMVIMDHACSHTSSDHLSAISSAIPKDVKVIRTHRDGGYMRNNVDFTCCRWQTLMPYYMLQHLAESIISFESSRTISARSNLGFIQSVSDDINWLFDNRSDCKIKDMNEQFKYLNSYNNRKGYLKKLFRLVRKKLTPKDMIDAMSGDGTYEAYLGRIKSQLKAERTRKFVNWFNRTHHAMNNPFTKAEIMSMPIDEKVLRACLPAKTEAELRSDDYQFKLDNNKRLAKYLFGVNGHLKVGYDYIQSDVVINKFTKESYIFESDAVYTFFPYCENMRKYDEHRNFFASLRWGRKYSEPYFMVEKYKLLKDKDQFMKRFYQKCKIISEHIKDLNTWAMMVVANDEQLNGCTEEDFARYNRIQVKFAQYQEDERARKLAEEQEKKRLEEERKRLDEERKLKYASYVERGIQGYRDLYYEKLDNRPDSRFGNELFFGGNVLLRWKTNEIIETSKNILVTIPQAKMIYKKVSAWHDRSKKFSKDMLQTKSGNYQAISYNNDILTAGCHQIAWCEMDRMYQEILKRESIQ